MQEKIKWMTVWKNPGQSEVKPLKGTEKTAEIKSCRTDSDKFSVHFKCSGCTFHADCVFTHSDIRLWEFSSGGTCTCDLVLVCFEIGIWGFLLLTGQQKSRHMDQLILNMNIQRMHKNKMSTWTTMGWPTDVKSISEQLKYQGFPQLFDFLFQI